jgi:hypothetical protein
MSIAKSSDISVDLLSVGYPETPLRRARIFDFLTGFGYTRDNAVKILSKSLGLDYYNLKDVYGSRVLSPGLVVKDSVLYSARPIIAKELLDDNFLPGIKSVGSISEKDIIEAKDLIGVKHYYVDVGLKKLFQDTILYAYNNSVRYLSIYAKERDFFVLYSNGYYSFTPEYVEIDRHEFEKLSKYLSELFSRDYDRSDECGVIEYDLSDEVIYIEVKITPEERNITMELLYRNNNIRISYGDTKVPPALELYNGVSVFSYDVLETRDKLLLSIRSNLVDDCIAYVYDTNIMNFPEADISIKMTADWSLNAKVRQAKIIVIEVTDYKNIENIKALATLNKAIIIIMPSGGIINTINTIGQAGNFKVNKYDYYHAVPNTCSYCATMEVLQVPFTYRNNIKTGHFISSGTEVIKRNKDGCPRCNFGMSDFVVYVNRLIVDKKVEDILSSRAITMDDLESMKGVYIDPVNERIGHVNKKDIDPIDIIGI